MTTDVLERPMIQTHALTKRYGAVHAVQGVDLQVNSGDIYGFLGANGSGKTTTVRMLLGLVLATSGQIELLGEPMPRRRRHVLPRVGTLVEGPAAYGHLSGRANLTMLDAAGPGGSRRTRRRRVEEVLEEVGLATVGRRPVKHYSLGMRQRLGLANALLRAPELLVLDEPTNGLDPQGIREIRELLLKLHAGGTTVFLSSHLLAEVEQLCTRVGVLDRGRLVVQDSMAAMTSFTGRVLVHTPDAAWAVTVLQAEPGVVVHERVADEHDECLLVAHPSAEELNATLVRAGVRVRELRPERRSLEQTVLAATEAHGAREQQGGVR
ncbi:ABC transporter ATP-binding protein [Rhodococcus sp. X156]|uniref:ABC transporter ATP-binding protein n=1 Tax=Rhodococcus sp. X156 TaxID=2499145 RepID=UPI001F49B267|nr:ABC transporter ATP-binding protein [Rhodococcus sp. X156]